MTVNREDIVTAIIAAADGRLTSRVRLQKSAYLLDRLGLKSGFGYEYYHYGPFSRDLENATVDARAFDLLKETFGRRGSDGAMYSIFETDIELNDDALGKLTVSKAKKLMQRFVETNVTVLELAATIDWLWRFEKVKDWKSEIKKRKGVKAKEERLQKAIDLLKELKLQPPSSIAA